MTNQRASTFIDKLRKNWTFFKRYGLPKVVLFTPRSHYSEKSFSHSNISANVNPKSKRFKIAQKVPVMSLYTLKNEKNPFFLFCPCKHEYSLGIRNTSYTIEQYFNSNHCTLYVCTFCIVCTLTSPIFLQNSNSGDYRGLLGGGGDFPPAARY